MSSTPSESSPTTVSLPAHAESEASLLSAMLGHGRAVVAEVAALLTSEDFFFANHRAIFDAILQVFSEGLDIVPESVAEALNRRVGGLKDVGGIDRLSQLAQSPPGARGVVPTAKILVKYRTRRQLIHAACKIAALAADPQEDFESVLTRSVALVQQTALSDTASARTEKAHEIGARVERLVRERAAAGVEILGVATGLTAWDRLVSGIVPRKLNLVAGASGMGKTASLLTMAHGTVLAGSPALVFSLEMENDALWYRALSMHSRIDSRRIGVGELAPAEWERFEAANAHWSSLPIEFNDWAGMTTRDIEAATRDFVSRRVGKHPPTIYLDYAQIIANLDDKDTTTAQQIQRNIYALRELAKNLNLGMVVLAQLNRDVDKREDKRPRLSDIADSSGLVKAADTITLLYRPAYYAQLKATEEGSEGGDLAAVNSSRYLEAPPDEAEWIVAKCRDGGTRSIRMTYHPTRTMFTSGGLDMRGF